MSTLFTNMMHTAEETLLVQAAASAMKVALSGTAAMLARDKPVSPTIGQAILRYDKHAGSSAGVCVAKGRLDRALVQGSLLGVSSRCHMRAEEYSNCRVWGFAAQNARTAIRAFRSRLGLIVVCFVVVGPVLVCVCAGGCTSAAETTAHPWARTASSFGHERMPAMTAALKEPLSRRRSDRARLSAERASGLGVFCQTVHVRGGHLGSHRLHLCPLGVQASSFKGGRLGCHMTAEAPA